MTTPQPSAPRGGRGARERIAAAAATLFYRQGIRATGVEELASVAGVSKRTFYQHFSSKDDLVRSYLLALDEQGGTALERNLERTELRPRERLLAIFDASPVDRFRGCPFHNAAVESAGSVDGVDEIVRDHKLRFAQRLSDIAAEAGAPDPRQLGNQLLVLFEGATALATSLNDTAPLVHARAAAAGLVNAAAE